MTRQGASYILYTKIMTYITKKLETDARFFYSVRGNKKVKPEFSRITGGGSTSEMTICSIDLDMSSTEKGILQQPWMKPGQRNIYNKSCIDTEQDIT